MQGGQHLARGRFVQAAHRARLTFRRLAGLDRSGPPPPETLAGQPWNVATIPNAIGFVRLGLVHVLRRLGFVRVGSFSPPSHSSTR